MNPLSGTLRAAPHATASARFTIGNTGLGDLHANVGAPLHDPPFSELDGGAIAVGPGSSKGVIIVYAPTMKGSTKDKILISSDDPKQHQPTEVRLKGESK